MFYAKITKISCDKSFSAKKDYKSYIFLLYRRKLYYNLQCITMEFTSMSKNSDIEVKYLLRRCEASLAVGEVLLSAKLSFYPVG